MARRIERRLAAAGLAENPEGEELAGDVAALLDLLAEFEGGDEPPDEKGEPAAAEAAAIGRRIVDGIERLELGEDRLGQAVRNLFECLGLGEEGAEISLRAGENPSSLMRPV